MQGIAPSDPIQEPKAFTISKIRRNTRVLLEITLGRTHVSIPALWVGIVSNDGRITRLKILLPGTFNGHSWLRSEAGLAGAGSIGLIDGLACRHDDGGV